MRTERVWILYSQITISKKVSTRQLPLDIDIGRILKIHKRLFVGFYAEKLGIEVIKLNVKFTEML